MIRTKTNTKIKKKEKTKSKKASIPQGLDVNQALSELQKNYPDAHCALHYQTPFQLLIATILSAQCTDERVNIVTKVLFEKYPDAHALSEASLPQIEKIIHSAGFYKNKAKNIKSCSQTLVSEYSGEVPKELELLTPLAGVGRKTANVVLGNAFNIISGVVVDTHVGRLSRRWGWTKSENAVEIERDLQKIIPHEHWIMISHWLIWHGRALCKARGPACDRCFLFDRCPKIAV